MSATNQILIADDERDLLWALQHSLGDEGYQVLTARDGLEALSQVRRHHPDLIILDINMPQLSGLEVCRRLRREPRFASIPIIFLTVDSRIEDRVTGLDGGCDDYVVKPFDLRELKARVRAVLRRSRNGPSDVPESAALQVGTLELDAKRRVLHKGDKTITLTPIEFSLLRCLMASPGEVVPIEQLLHAVWGYDRSSASAGLIRWHIRNLRRKVEADPASPTLLRTQSHFGYMLVSEELT
jgi:DNA-binding response OmpR family regulator